MKIVTEDKAIESRTNDFLNDWERAKPVAGDLRPGEINLVQYLDSITKFYLPPSMYGYHELT